MTVVFGTRDGLWQIEDGTSERIGLAGKAVSHVADRNSMILASVPRDGLYKISNGRED